MCYILQPYNNQNNLGENKVEINNKDVRFWLLNNNLVNKGFYNGKYVIDNRVGTYNKLSTTDVRYTNILKPAYGSYPEFEVYGELVGEKNVGENIYSATGSTVSTWYRGNSKFANYMNNKEFITTNLDVDIHYWKDGKALISGAVPVDVYFYGTKITLVATKSRTSETVTYRAIVNNNAYTIEDPNVLQCYLYFNSQDNKIHKHINIFGYKQIDEVLDYNYLMLDESIFSNDSGWPEPNTDNCRAAINCWFSISDGDWGTGYVEFVQKIIAL